MPNAAFGEDDLFSWQQFINNFKTTGYLDGSYNYLQDSNEFISGVHDRVFDLNENGFTLQQAALTVASQPARGIGGLVNVILGKDAFTIASYGLKPLEIDDHEIGADLTQAYLQYATHAFTVIAGKFVSLAGAEVINSTQNTQFSASILDGYAEPFTHTGVRGTFTVDPKLTLVLGVNNGWDSIADTGRVKTLELSAAYIFNPQISSTLTSYTGQERSTAGISTGPLGWRTLIDWVATWNVTQQLSFVANYDYGTQNNALLGNGTIGNAIWQGIAGYINYRFNDQWRISVRGEYFNDENGFRTGVAQEWEEGTLTIGYKPIKNLELRAETRHDFSDVNSFNERDGDGVSNQNQSYALEAIYLF
jgi:hypothetical protein